ncbi:hypothetical protein QFC21_003935 [Naganishia friedmannii]|uniref:Uncharacterized protein n=1 Tax=Naganishia friedmannii TaxID=89922 RepID=A0ACC2VM06_9TREE|nr:hypothetical protein QFC21_003935 [Naganishia friedmannii]
MPYSTRNALYLRISSWTVLPLYLYLDERHVGWMNDATLQSVLADLRPKLLAKFHAEDPNLTKKSTVEVHRGGYQKSTDATLGTASYQFAFFFRKKDTRHVVLLKVRPSYLYIHTATDFTAPYQRREYIPQATRRPQSLAIPPKPNLEDPADLPSRRPKPTPKRKAPEETTFATDTRRSTRARSEINYAQDMRSSSPPLREEDSLMSPLQEETAPPPQPALFLDGGDDDLRLAPTSPLIQVKDEPRDPIPTGLPARSEAEKGEMYAGARESLGRTIMDTGFEDTGDGLADGGGVDRDGSEELLTFRPVVDDQEEEKKDSKMDVKPSLRLSYKGFSISSRHLVLIIEPYPPLTAAPKPSARARSTYASRSMSRATDSRARGSMSTFAQGFERDETTRLIPNSRSGGTSTPSAFQSATPAPSMRAGGSNGQTPIPNSRSGGRTGTAAGTPLPFRMSATPARSARNGAAGTPLFRDMTPMSEFGGGDAGNGDRAALFDDDREGSSEEEDKEWRRRTRGSSYAPWRGTSVIGGQETSRPTPTRNAPVSDSDDSDSLGGDDDLPSSDDEDAQEIAQARRLMALSQRLQENTSGRQGVGAMSGAGRVVDAGELGGGIGDDDAFGDGDEGGEGEFGRDDVGGADA